MIPQAVVFDLGKVLLNFDYGIAIGRIQTRCKLNPTELKELLDQSPLLYRYETNLLTTQEFFQEVRLASGFFGDILEFGEFFSDIFTPIPLMIALHGALRARSIPTFIFS